MTIPQTKAGRALLATARGAEDDPSTWNTQGYSVALLVIETLEAIEHAAVRAALLSLRAEVQVWYEDSAADSMIGYRAAYGHVLALIDERLAKLT